MTKRTTFLTRFLAMALALVLCASNVMPGLALRASAAGPAMTEARMLAGGYSMPMLEKQLSMEEQALLNSGYLKSETREVTPLQGEVKIDGNTITVEKNIGNWGVCGGGIEVGGQYTPVDPEDLCEDGVATFETDALAYTVRVQYLNYQTISLETQEKLLNAHATLKQGVANLNKGAGTNAKLDYIKLLIPELVGYIDADMAEILGIEEATDAINALNAQINANGVLDLQAMNQAYAAANAYEYLKTNGAAYKAKAAETAAHLETLSKLKEKTKLAEALIEAGHENTWNGFVENVSETAETLGVVAAADWSGADLIADSDVNYADLQAKVEAITATTEVELVEILGVMMSEISAKSDNAVDVNVVIELYYTYENEVIRYVNDVTNSMVVAKGATPGEVLAVINPAEGEAIAKNMVWAGVYEEGQFERSVSELPETVTEPVTYTVTYSPKKYDVNFTYDNETKSLPYGYVVTLPVAGDDASYDYFVNDEAAEEGSQITIVGETTIERLKGAQYKSDDLYKIVAKNSSNAVDQAILNSGALEGDTAYKFRVPTQDSVEMKLEDGTLSAPTYNSGKLGNWVPNRYGVKGAEAADMLSFNGATTAAYDVKEADVVYRLSVDADVSDVPAKLAYIKEQAYEAKGALDGLTGEIHSEMGDLTQGMLAGITSSVKFLDLTPGDGNQNDQACKDLRVYFTDLINSITGDPENYDVLPGNYNLATGNLKLYDMITEYIADGLAYYYTDNNVAAVRKEVAELSKKLNGLVGDEAKEIALGVIMGDYFKNDPEKAERYISKIKDIGTKLTETNEGLAMDIKYIDCTSANLGKLMEALSSLKEEDIKTNALAEGAPYMETTLTVRNSSLRAVQAQVYVNNNYVGAVSTDGVLSGEILPAGSMSALLAGVEKLAKAEINNVEGLDKFAFYTRVQVEGAAEDGMTMDKNVTVVYNYMPDVYTVKVEGMDDQYITIEDREINLERHPNHPGVVNEYTIDGETGIFAQKYTFTAEQLTSLFTNNTYTVGLYVNKQNQEDFANHFEDLNPVYADAEKEVLAGLNPTQPINGAGIKEMGSAFVSSKYSYVELNGVPFIENNTDGLQVHMDALIGAMLADDEFGSERLIALAQGKEKVLVTSKMSLNPSKPVARSGELMWNDLDFVWAPESIPEKMVTVGNALNAVRDYLKFQSAGDGKTMNVTLNLPQPVYEVYLTALLATGNLDKSDVNAINNQIAFQFFYDYLKEVVANEKITADTYENTLNMMIKEFNDIADKAISAIEVSQYKNHYEALRRALNGERVTYNFDADKALVTMEAFGKDMNAIINAMGIDLGGYENMVYELNYPETKILTDIKVTLVNAVDSQLQAAVIDLANHGGKKQTAIHAYDFTTDLIARAAALKGETAIMLLDNVTGDLNIAQSGIIDLNGKTITGNLNFTGRKLIIVDSCQDTKAAGGITGSIKGDVVILAGEYNTNVDSFLRDGYYKDSDNFVKNALYTVEGGIYNIDTVKLFDENYVEGYLPAVHYLAAELAIDLVLNYYTAASLSVDNYDLYAISFDDIVGILGTDSNKGKVSKVLNDLLGMFRFEGPNGEQYGGIDGFINQVIADLTDFSAIAAAVESGEKVVGYTFTTHPWSISIDHIENGDYMTVGIVPNEKITDKFTVGLAFSGANKDKVLPYLNELAQIVEKFDVKIDLHQPEIISDELQIGGGAVADIVLDFSHNCDYNRMLAAVLAFAHEDLTEEFIENGCIMDLNDILAEITVGEFFSAIKKAVEAKEWDFAALAAKAGVELTNAQVDKLNEYYDKFQNGAGKILSKLEVRYDDTTPMAELMNPHAEIGSGIFVIDGYIGEKHPDASYRGYGVQFNLDKIDAKITVKLAPKCNGLWGDVNWDGKVNTKDATCVLRYYVDLIEGNELHRCVADVNGDGKINTKDATLILRHYVDLIGKFPVEE
ncbi:MAG: dockerin type I repeat-containing protein [Oscillospiraceae bacterium]|nr:dockerin type I repeat-containing protein [Oscillospiraceae bacterium]